VGIWRGYNLHRVYWRNRKSYLAGFWGLMQKKSFWLFSAGDRVGDLEGKNIGWQF